MKHNVMVCFDDGNNMVITNADEYSINTTEGYAAIIKNAHRIMFNFAKVKCIGYEEDING